MPPTPPSLLSASHSVTAAAVLRKGERATREKRERSEAKREREPMKMIRVSVGRERRRGFILNETRGSPSDAK